MADADFRGVFHRTAISISYFLAHGEQKGTEIRCACMRMCFTFSLSFFFVVLWNEENGRTLFALVPNMGNDFLKFFFYPLRDYRCYRFVIALSSSIDSFHRWPRGSH